MKPHCWFHKENKEKFGFYLKNIRLHNIEDGTPIILTITFSINKYWLYIMININIYWNFISQFKARAAGIQIQKKKLLYNLIIAIGINMLKSNSINKKTMLIIITIQ